MNVYGRSRPLVLRVGLVRIDAQREHRDLRRDVEADVPQVAEAAVNVELAAVEEINFAGNVPAIVHRHDRRRQERRLALAAVRVAAQNPALIALPNIAVGRVGVVAQEQVGLVAVQMPRHRLGVARRSPQIVHAGHRQAGHVAAAVAQHQETEVGESGRQLVGYWPIAVVAGEVVVAENSQRRHAARPQVLHHPADVVQFLVGPAGHEIASDDEEVRVEPGHGPEGAAEVVVGHFRADVQVADLHQRLAAQRIGQAADGQVAAHHLVPVRLDEPGIRADAGGAGEQAGGGRLQEGAARRGRGFGHARPTGRCMGPSRTTREAYLVFRRPVNPRREGTP